MNRSPRTCGLNPTEGVAINYKHSFRYFAHSNIYSSFQHGAQVVDDGGCCKPARCSGRPSQCSLLEPRRRGSCADGELMYELPRQRKLGLYTSVKVFRGWTDIAPSLQGMTTLLLTHVPHFRDIMVASFECEHCNFRYNKFSFWPL